MMRMAMTRSSCYIDRDNLDVLTTPPPDAQLTMLGIVIDIDVTNGITKIEHEEDHVKDERKFKDLVASVDVPGGTFSYSPRGGPFICFGRRSQGPRIHGEQRQLRQDHPNHRL